MDVYYTCVCRCTCTTHTQSLGNSLSCLSPSPFIPPLSYLKSHITASLNRRAALAQGIVARPTACGRKDRQMDMPGLLVPGSWLLVPVPDAVPDAWAGARWLARRLRNEADLVRIPSSTTPLKSPCPSHKSRISMFLGCNGICDTMGFYELYCPPALLPVEALRRM